MEKNNKEKIYEERKQKFWLDQTEIKDELIQRYREETNWMSQREKSKRFKVNLFNLTRRYCRRFNLKIEQEEFSELMWTISKTITDKTNFVKEKTENKLSENLQQKSIEDIIKELSENEKEKLSILFNNEKVDINIFSEDLKYELQNWTKIDKAITKTLTRHNIFESDYKKKVTKDAILKFFKEYNPQNGDIKNFLDSLKKKFKKRKVEKQMNITDFIK